MADEALARSWLRSLGRLTAATMTPQEAADWLDEIAPFLASRFPDEAFVSASLEHVAAESRYLPTYGEIVSLLRAFQERQPATIAIAARPGGLTPQEEAMAANWVRHAQGEWGKVVPRDPATSMR